MYTKLISDITGITGAENLRLIEECMRNDIFHSTLDWQTRDEFERGAIEAIALLFAAGELA